MIELVRFLLKDKIVAAKITEPLSKGRRMNPGSKDLEDFWEVYKFLLSTL